MSPRALTTHAPARPHTWAAWLAAVTLALMPATAAPAAWPTYGGNAQHTALTTVATQPLQQIHWQAPVDLKPHYSGSTLLIHYGSPLITPGNTVVFPVKTGVSDTFRVEARLASNGTLLWQLLSDYQVPAASWTPSMGITLTPAGRLYAPGAGGTVLHTDALDAPTDHLGTRVAFFGDAAYASNPGAYNSSLRVCTPLTSGSDGTVYFGVRASSANPLGITSGIASVSADGTGHFVSAMAASGGVSAHVAFNCAPALSHDGHLLYVATRGIDSAPAYLLALSTADLSTVAVAPLPDPGGLARALVPNNGTASPMVAPDGKVFFGVLENPFGSNAVRGWLLQFDSLLTPTGPPGAFGWDDTPSVVPASIVPSYTGASPYLLMCKYNFYAGFGDGVNKLAILDPGASQVDGYSGVTVMKEVLTIAGPTPDMDERPTYPDAVREWCINTAVVDPLTHSVLAGSEDGALYRWDLTTNSFPESVTLTPGIGEAYTPTISGPDGQVYAINNATLFAVGSVPGGVLPSAGAGGAEHVKLLLSPARPNPFARDVTLRFTLTTPTAVALDILDLAGHRVARVWDRLADAGEHAVHWDGRDASGARSPPGMYFARLSTNSPNVRPVTHKLLLVR